MTLHPEVQKRAQEELDLVVGPDRLPSLEDRPNLPYVEAVVKEVLRWNPVGPLGQSSPLGQSQEANRMDAGVPHRLIEDDVYEGYLIPKGTLIIPNMWYVCCPSPVRTGTHSQSRKWLHDAEINGPNPYDFDPSRFLGENPVRDPKEFLFGFGRR